MVIDFHTHCFPEKIAERAIGKLSATSGLMPYTDGTAEGLKKLMKQDGVDISVVGCETTRFEIGRLPWASKASQRNGNASSGG